MKHAAVFTLLLTALAAPAIPQPTGAAPDSAHAAQVKIGGATTDGEIRRVDRDAKKLTIRHGAIQNLDMPPMTMVFQVQEAMLLDNLRIGEKVKFRAERIGGGYALTAIEVVN